MEPEIKQFCVMLKGTRPDWPEKMTESEEKIMVEHYDYLKELTAKKKIILAGPCFEPVFGLIILQTESEQEAKELMEKEPSVVSGLHTYELNPMRVSLLTDNRLKDRYVSDPSDKIIRKEVVVKAALGDVWRAWTTTDGVKSFFSSEARVELYTGGPFEIYFMHDAPYGLKGSEDCKILSYIPNELLCFEWNAPSDFGKLRDIKTQVALRFENSGDVGAKVSLAHYSWGKTEKWDKLYDYFDSAWSYVLNNLKKSFEEKPEN